MIVALFHYSIKIPVKMASITKIANCKNEKILIKLYQFCVRMFFARGHFVFVFAIWQSKMDAIYSYLKIARYENDSQ